MSAPYQNPTSKVAEKELQNLHSHDIKAEDIAIGVIIGRTSEFFDFFVYAIASVLVFPKIFFSNYEPVEATLYSFAVFALAFVARPFGSLIFMAIDKAYGKAIKLTIALFLLGTSTVVVAFIPSFQSVGYWCILALAICRIGQGLAMGGVWDGLASLLALNAPENKRGWYAMIPQLGAPAGLIVASLLFAYFTLTLSAADFLDWGWRFPFFVAFAINVVALFARLRIVVTPEYRNVFESSDLKASNVIETVRVHWLKILVGSFVPLASFAMFHMVSLFPLSWIFLFTKENPSRFLIIEAMSAVVGIGGIILSGIIADRISRRKQLFAGAVLIAMFSGFAPQLLSAGEAGIIAFMIIGFLLLGLSFGQSSGATASQFTSKYRYTASAITTDIAWLFGAGFAPFAALFLSTHFGLLSAGGYLLSGCICTIIALSYDMHKRQQMLNEKALQK